MKEVDLIKVELTSASLASLREIPEQRQHDLQGCGRPPADVGRVELPGWGTKLCILTQQPQAQLTVTKTGIPPLSFTKARGVLMQIRHWHLKEAIG
jgi:hypothetical protein